MRIIFYISLLHGHDSVVLSAMGCGVFKNPPGHIAELFSEVLAEENFRGKFKHILFAIFDDANSGQKHNPDGNLLPFRRVFSVVPDFHEKVEHPFPIEIITGKKESHDKNNANNHSNQAKTKLPACPCSSDSVIYFSSPQAPYGCFSPLFKSPFVVNGTEWLSVEHYLYANKYRGTEYEDKIRKIKQPNRVKEESARFPVEAREGWEDEKNQIMEEANLAKFQQHPQFKKILIEDTGTKKIVFIDTDLYWGSDVDKGDNILGSILIKIREILRE